MHVFDAAVFDVGNDTRALVELHHGDDVWHLILEGWMSRVMHDRVGINSGAAGGRPPFNIS